MTISQEIVSKEARHVPQKATEMVGFKNPFITLGNLEALCEGDEVLTDCLQTMVIDSLRYAETVCRFEQIVARGQVSNENGDREEIERVRSSVHDTTISSINILSRTLSRKGKDNKWISKVAAGDRAGYGKFALMIAFEIVLHQKGGTSAS